MLDSAGTCTERTPLEITLLRESVVKTAVHPQMNRDTLFSEARSKWSWFIALGVALLILGAVAFANLLVATFVSVVSMGAIMTVGAVAQIVMAFRVKTWSGFLLWWLSGLLYGAAGVLTIYNPLLAAGVLTLILAFALLFSGAMRVSVGVRSRPATGWIWAVASGVMSILVGIIIMLRWPADTLLLLGLVLAIDLTFQGVASLMFGIALRASADDKRRVESTPLPPSGRGVL
jgi:uncharacterized membrane protein HdeD (DUF308 family)